LCKGDSEAAIPLNTTQIKQHITEKCTYIHVLGDSKMSHWTKTISRQPFEILTKISGFTGKNFSTVLN